MGWFALVVLLFVASRFASVFTESIHWDEFALFASVDRLINSGFFETGGHLGLATLLLTPFTESCIDEIGVVQAARVLWLGVTGSFLIGLAMLLRKMQIDPQRRFWDAAVGVGLLALLPVFLEWSIQVRPDQLALAGGVWGGVALLGSQDQKTRLRCIGLAFLAGTLIGLGWLSSRKVAYVALLIGVLAVGRIFMARDWTQRPAQALPRDFLRALFCALGFLAVFYSFRAGLQAAPVSIPSGHSSETILSAASLTSGLSVFDFYRKTIGYSQYKVLIPTLGAHFLMLAALSLASFTALRRRIRADSLPIAWAILAAGIVVGLFHAGAFSYFTLTLGLFPAVAFAVSRWEVQALVFPESGRTRMIAVISWWMLLALPGAGAALQLLRDSQGIQRESMAFIHDNFDSEDSGFHPEGSLFCQAGVQPVRTFFSQTIYYAFATSEAAREVEIQEVLNTHREEPIRFLLNSFRLNQFPLALRQFWSDNYQPYRASVFVAGRHLEGPSGTTTEFELIVAGDYRWLPKTGPQKLWIGQGSEGEGLLLSPGQIVFLKPGTYAAHFVEDVPEGMLVLAMNEPPGPAPQVFYKSY